MEVAEILVGALGTLQWIDIGFQLNEISGNEARGETEAARDLHQQPSRITARAGSQRQRFFRLLNTGFHADQIPHALLQSMIQVDQERNGSLLTPRKRRDEIGDQRSYRTGAQVGCKVRPQFVRVGEREGLRISLDEEIERIDHRHRGGEMHLDTKFGGRLGKNKPGEPVAVRILLPVDEVLFRVDLERVAVDGGTTMGRWPQSDDLRSQRDQAVVLVGCDVVKCDQDGHER